MSENYLAFKPDPPDPPVAGYYVLSTGAPPDSRWLVSAIQLAMYQKPPWFHRTMMWLCFGIVWRGVKP